MDKLLFEVKAIVGCVWTTLSHLGYQVTLNKAMYRVYILKLREQSRCSSVSLLFNAVPVCYNINLRMIVSHIMFDKRFSNWLFPGDLKCAQNEYLYLKTLCSTFFEVEWYIMMIPIQMIIAKFSQQANTLWLPCVEWMTEFVWEKEGSLKGTSWPSPSCQSFVMHCPCLPISPSLLGCISLPE